MSYQVSGEIRAGIRLGWVLLVLTGAGCGFGGPSYYEKQKAIYDRSIDFLKDRGAKCTPRRYPEGTAWLIDMQGLTLTDEVLEHLKRVGYITELNLSRSNISDGQLATINNRAVSGFLLKLDLSKTAITDAGLDHLTDLGLLSTLLLTDTKVTADGIARFKKKRADDPRIAPPFKTPKIVW
jgi:hypothetical protein